MRAAATPWLAHNAIFQAARLRLQRYVSGRPHFTPEEVIDRSLRTIGALLRHESAYVVVVGPSGGHDWAGDEAARRRMEVRRAKVEPAVAAYCADRHIEYWPPSTFDSQRALPRSLQGDGLHLDAEGHRQTAERYFEMSLELCRRAIAHHAPGDARPVADARSLPAQPAGR